MWVRPAVVAGLVAGLTTGPLVAAPAYAVDNVCDSVDSTTPHGDTGRPSVPFQLLGMADAQAEVARTAGGGGPVRVAVLSSGVLPAAVPVATGVDLSGGGNELTDPQGTVVAGLVAGPARAGGEPVGFAPAAQVVDVRVFVSRESNVPQERPDAAHLASGLRWVAHHAGAQAIKVAVVPFVVRTSAAVRAAVQAVQAAGVVLVAASGDRPADGGEFSGEISSSPAPDEDAGPLFFPAGYPGVVAVNAAPSGDPRDTPDGVVKNSRTVVAAPAYHAVSYGLNGDTCLVEPASTAAAAGEVAGVLALLWQQLPAETAAQAVARLVDTADGTPDDRTPLTGAGVVQPLEALTRPLDPSPDGTLERTRPDSAAPARAATADPGVDLLASVRERALWWGLIGGGLLVIALLLRPVLARRRT